MPDLARRLPSGTILVEARENPLAGRVVLYARVSAHDERADLDRQIARLPRGRPARVPWWPRSTVRVGSAMNRHRSKLRRLLAGPQVHVIVVEHRHRLARFGVEHLEAALSVLAAESWSPIPARPATTWCGT
jgi:putative resolvase